MHTKMTVYIIMNDDTYQFTKISCSFIGMIANTITPSRTLNSKQIFLDIYIIVNSSYQDCTLANLCFFFPAEIIYE